MSLGVLFGRTPAASAHTGGGHWASRGVFTVREFWLVTAVALAVWSAFVSQPFVRGLSLVVRGAEVPGLARGFSGVGTVPFRERVIAVPLRQGSVRGRLYLPLSATRQTVLLVPGVQIAGMDDPRIVLLARELARSQVNVLTPDLPELSRFELTSALTDHIEDAALWLAVQSGLATDNRIGMMGISFSGGLTVVAAGRPSLRRHVSYVFAFGAHDDLPRVLRYLSTGLPPPVGTLAERARIPVPHDYGLAILLLGIADRLVPANQVPPLRDAVRRFLSASYLERSDKAGADREYAALRTAARHLPEPAATLLGYVNSRDVVRLGARLSPYICFYGDDPALSPSRSPAPTAPVFLLHGADDNVVPASESEQLASRLRGKVEVRLLVTGLVSHADTDQPARIIDVLELAGFWGDLLDR
jgi:dienelactone hydrolase